MSLQPTQAQMNAKRIFLEAIEIPVADRCSFIQNACAGDLQLHTAVSELTAIFESQTDSSLDTKQIRTALDRAKASGFTRSFVPDLLEHSGADGNARYLILDLRNVDAWGDVYHAIQIAPVQRCVTLKTITAEHRSCAIEEIKIAICTAATLQHPGIVSIFDSGVDEKYGAFLAMEPVEGTVITDFCNQQNLSVRQRLDCFIAVCRCLEFIHSSGCIFRDLEPSNVLIVDDGDGGTPRIINFGVAITLSKSDKEMKHLSETRNEFELPAYKAPEQLKQPDSRLSHRCDIYSLGVLLFELLTNELPFSSQVFAPMEYAEKLRYLCEVPPLRLGFYQNSDFANKLATWSGVSVKQLHARLKCDLEPIALKCLSKGPKIRYKTVTELIADIERVTTGKRSSVGGKGIKHRLYRWLGAFR